LKTRVSWRPAIEKNWSSFARIRREKKKEDRNHRMTFKSKRITGTVEASPLKKGTSIPIFLTYKITLGQEKRRGEVEFIGEGEDDGVLNKKNIRKGGSFGSRGNNFQ